MTRAASFISPRRTQSGQRSVAGGAGGGGSDGATAACTTPGSAEDGAPDAVDGWCDLAPRHAASEHATEANAAHMMPRPRTMAHTYHARSRGGTPTVASGLAFRAFFWREAP